VRTLLSDSERRRRNINNATPEGTLKEHIDANERQIGTSGILDEIPEDHVLSDMFRRDGTNYQVHHIVPARTYERLYLNADEKTTAELTNILRGGNSHENLFITPNRSHNGISGISKGIHARLRSKGYEVGGGVELKPLIQRLENSADLPADMKIALAKDFVNAKEDEGGRQDFINMLNDVLSENEEWAHQNRSQAKSRAQAYKNIL
jgi:hypothetical protein